MNDVEFNRESIGIPGEPVETSQGTRRVLCDNPGPFTFTGTSTFIIGHGEVAIIDPGPDNEAHIASLLKAVSHETVSHIVLTHTHADHSPLAAKLKALTGAKTYGYGPHGSGRGEAGLRADASADFAFTPDVRMKHGDL